jgi:hypothetical protein
MSEMLPAPLTPADMHGRDLGPMPFDKDLFADTKNIDLLMSPDRAKLIAIALMERAWNVRPVASIPAKLNTAWCYGSPVTKAFWKKHKDVIFGDRWTLCSDGRLYNIWLAKQANKAISRRRNLAVPPGRWQEIRQIVFERDKFTCQHCGAIDVPLVVDHVHPVIAGGSSDLSNLVASCSTCNQTKAAKIDWGRPVQ